MTKFADMMALFLSASPTVLALLLGLFAVGISGFALFLVYRVLQRGAE